MKKIVLFLTFLICSYYATCQNYNNIINYHFNDTPQHGVKIKTNLPFTNGSQMPVVNIVGYNYQNKTEIVSNATLNLQISWYIYDGAFYAPTMSSAGGSAPAVWLSNENGKVIIFLDQMVYFQRFNVSVFAQGTAEKPEYFSGWTVKDEARGGTAQVKVPYKNVFGDKVGIGIENPQHNLDVAGNIRAQNIILTDGYRITPYLGDNFTYKNMTFGNYALGWVADDWNLSGRTMWQSGYSGIKFFTGKTMRMTISQAGNIGIGTENPQNKLEVNGTIRATEVKVETGWADFVFDKDYRLPSLKEVEAHINEHKRLPDIPSEAQVKEEGVGLGEMQVKLLQKIEELTLYTIQQQKLINSLQEKVSQLETKIPQQ